MDPEVAKRQLQEIIALAKLRREAREEFEERQAQYSAPAVQAQPPVPAPIVEPQPQQSVVEVEPEPTFETHPHLFVTTKTAELVEYIEARGTDHEVRYEVLSGRTLIGHRRRRPEDGDRLVVFELPKSRQRPRDETMDFGTKDEWRSDVLNGRLSGAVDPRVITLYGNKPTSRPPWIDRNRGFAMQDRNHGVMQVDGTIRGE